MILIIKLKVYFDANDLDQLSNRRIEIIKKREYRNYVNKHLNQSLFISSPYGRLISHVKAFLEKYVELKN